MRRAGREHTERMSFLDRAKHKLEEVIGEVKETFGEATGNQALEVSGEAEADAAREREEEDEEHERAAHDGPTASANSDDPDSDPTDSDDGRGGVPAR